jgi:site-specific DNA recombinase
MKRSPTPARPPARVRCAIYTRKSTEEGLDQDFNSLDAQRESALAYIASQQHEGWMALHDNYDDGGFTGGNMERPALQQLLADIAAGKVDCVVVYKVDRLSRSLLDFARMMEVFERHHVAFVAVTQQFNTATSMGRLVMNVLLSFAQFEREIISERTRDKIAAARRKGKWSGGMPVLGYDVEPRGGKLRVNEAEAKQVRAIFALYRDRQSLLRAVQELNRRDWRTKRWQTRKGHVRGGRPFNTTNLHKLLTNVAYVGKIRYKQEVHPGEHPAIVDESLWQQVQDLLRQGGPANGTSLRQPSGALLQGLLHCQACACAMSPSHTTGNGRRYRYYVCTNAQKRGRAVCPAKSLAARVVEGAVLDRLRGLGQDAALDHAQFAPALARLYDDALPTAERAQALRALVQRIDYDAVFGELAISLHPPTATAD